LFQIIGSVLLPETMQQTNSSSRSLELPDEAVLTEPSEVLVPADGDPSVARRCRREFYIMSIAFGLNHATVTTPILYAASVLTETIGNACNAVLYGSTLLSSLFLANLLYSIVGPKKGLVMSMLCYTVYVGLFAYSASQCDVHLPACVLGCLDKTVGSLETCKANCGCSVGGDLMGPAVYLGGFIGGMGAGLLWTCQGAFYSLVCEKIADAEIRPKEEVTAEFAGTFALIFLGFECLIRAMTTLLSGAQFLDLTYGVTFLIWTVAAGSATTFFALFSTNLQPPSQAPITLSSVTEKLGVAVKLWSDPKLWLLQTTNITFGFAAAWLGGYVGPNILTKALSSSFIGFAGAILSGLAAVLSKVFAPIAAKIGKGPILALGSVCFLCLGVLSKWFGQPDAEGKGGWTDWGYTCVVFYIFMGVGRAVYESTNKAIIGDFYAGPRAPAAFANVFVFGTAASCAAFVLGALKTTTPEVYMLVIFAGLTLPTFLFAQLLKAKGVGEPPGSMISGVANPNRS